MKPTNASIGTYITIGQNNIEIVKNFTNLGSNITADKNLSAEIGGRIIIENKRMRSLRKHFSILTRIVQKATIPQDNLS